MIYEYSCPNGHVFERILPMREYNSAQFCECGQQGEMIISSPKLILASKDVCYDSPIDGRPITSMAQHREDLARNHCRQYDPGMRQDADRFRKQSEAALDKAVDQTVDAAIDAMPVKKRERLERELKSGADAIIERRSV